MRAIPLGPWVIAALAAAFLNLAAIPSAKATAQACYRLVYVVNPSDLKLAYNFVAHHGECLAHFEDETFDAVATGITAAMAAGVIHPATCANALDVADSPAVKQLGSIANLDAVSSYLDCGCAVANSGIAQKIKNIAADMESCANTVDPRAIIWGGLQQAGKALGLDTLWGLEPPGPDPRAGVGNGGAPVTDMQPFSTCGVTGVDIAGFQPGDGYVYPSCNCPAPTAPKDGDGHWWYPHTGLSGLTFKCMAHCDPGQALQNGKCGFCPDLGPGTRNVPNAARTACVVTGFGQVVNPCKAWESWDGKTGCSNRCPGGIYQGGKCQNCPVDHQPSQNMCIACPAGAHGNGQSCTAAFPNPGCEAGQINDPAKAGQCTTCPSGTQPNGAGDRCLQFVCQGNAIPDPNRANTCMLCPAGTHPNVAGDRCQQFVCQGNAIPDPHRSNTCMLCPAGTHPNPAGNACIRQLPLPVPVTPAPVRQNP